MTDFDKVDSRTRRYDVRLYDMDGSVMSTGREIGTLQMLADRYFDEQFGGNVRVVVLKHKFVCYVLVRTLNGPFAHPVHMYDKYDVGLHDNQISERSIEHRIIEGLL